MSKDSQLRELQEISGVGKEISEDLWNIGIRTIFDLKNKDPEKLYKKLCMRDGKVDICMLYIFRCAVYYASGKRDKNLLKWWNWKDYS